MKSKAFFILFAFWAVAVNVCYAQSYLWNVPSSNNVIEDPTSSTDTELRDGSKEKPYTISTPQELANFAYYVNNKFSGDAYKGKYVVLTADIVLNENLIDDNGNVDTNAKEWVPIGEYGSLWNDSFEGIFDGQGHTISGVYVKTGREYNGLFGDLKHGSIKNLNVKDSYIVQGSVCTAGVVAHAHGSYSTHGGDSEQLIINCSFEGIIEGKDSNCEYVGGIIGHINTDSKFSVKNCTTGGRILNAKATYAGGVCAYGNAAEIKNCINRMDVTGGKDGGAAGGVVGYIYGVDNCFNYGSITNSAAKYVGGVAGYAKGPVQKCTNLADIAVTDSKTSHVGGVCGLTTGNITFCGNLGGIDANGTTPSGDLFIGGIVGQTGYPVRQSYNHGDITVSSGKVKYAGIIGDHQIVTNYANISDCFNTGNISGGYGIVAKVLTQGDMTGSNVLWLEGSAIQGFPGTDGATKRSKEYFTDNTIPGNAFIIMEKATGVHWGSDVNNNGYPVPDFLGGVNTYFYMQGEHGTEQNPYIVENIDDLNEIRRRLESGYPFEGEYISQIADFEFSADDNFVPLGVKFDIRDYSGFVIDFSESRPFAGIYNGNGHSIKGITANNVSKCGVALFAENRGIIKNLDFDGFTNIDNNKENAGMAVVAVTNSGTISNINVNNVNLKGAAAVVAGIAGTSSGVIEDVTVCNVILEGKQAGGVAGIDGGRIVNAMVYNADIEGMYAGGVAGTSSGSIEKTSVFNTDIEGMYLGGIVGVSECANVKHSTSAAAIDTRNYEPEQGKRPSMGGIAGFANGITIEECYAIADTSFYHYDSSKNPLLGGFFGCNDEVEKLQIKSSVAPWDNPLPENVHFGFIAGRINSISEYSISDLITYAFLYTLNDVFIRIGVGSPPNNYHTSNMSYLYNLNSYQRTDVEWDVKYFNSDNLVQGYKMVLPKYCPTTYAVSTLGAEPMSTYLDMTAVKPTDNTLFEPIEHAVVDEFYDLPNIVSPDGVVRNLVLVDGKDFEPGAKQLRAESINFNRSDARGWSAMCLPFDLDVNLLPEGSHAGVVSGITGPYVNAEAAQGVIPAGTPFLLHCKNSDFRLSVTGEDEYGISTLLGDDFLQGVYKQNTLNEGDFYLDADAGCFIRAKKDTVVNAFTAYLPQSKVNEPVDALPIIHKTLDTSRYYRLSVKGRYLSVDETGLTLSDDAEGTSTIFYYDENLSLLSYRNSRYIEDEGCTVAGNVPVMSLFEIAASGVDKYNLCVDGKYWGVDDDAALCSYSDVNEPVNAENVEWSVEEVECLPVSITTIGYATIYAGVALEVPDGITAHTVVVDGDYAILSDPLDIIPAGCGVLLVAEEELDGTKVYDFIVTTTDETVEDNALRGTLASTFVETEEGEQYYVLSNPDGVLAFYKAELNDGKLYNNGHRAYLPHNTAHNNAPSAIKFNWSTGIDDVKDAERGDALIYDLHGRRIDNHVKGVCIINGKKVLIK